MTTPGEPPTELDRADSTICALASQLAAARLEIAALKKRIELLESGWHGSYEANGQQTELL